MGMGTAKMDHGLGASGLYACKMGEAVKGTERRARDRPGLVRSVPLEMLPFWDGVAGMVI